MPRRSTLRPDLLALAHEVLAEEGYSGLSVRGLARKLGVSPGAIYYHFEGQGGIYRAVIHEGLCAIEAQLRAAFEAEADPVARVRAMAEAYCAFALNHPDTYHVVMTLREVGQPDVTEEERQPGRDAIALLAQSAAMAVAEITGKAPSPEEAEFLGLEVWAVLHGYVSLLVSERLTLAYPDFDHARFTQAGARRVLQMLHAPLCD